MYEVVREFIRTAVILLSVPIFYPSVRIWPIRTNSLAIGINFLPIRTNLFAILWDLQ